MHAQPIVRRWLLVFCFVSVATLAYSQTSERVRIASPAPENLAALLSDSGHDVLWGALSVDSIDLIVSPAEKALLTAAGHSMITVDVGIPFYQRQLAEAPPIGYLDLAAIQLQMTTAASTYPTICRLVDLTATYNMPSTAEGRSIMAIVISDNVMVDEDEPTMLIASNHHARELVTPVIALDAIDRLLQGYGSDPTITAAVNDHEIWIVPVVNPDGYEYVFTTDDFWRKNRNPGLSSVGVDPNRNYPLGWTAPCSGSSSEASGTYKGPSPASEAEVQTIMALSVDRHFAKVLDFHSSGRETLWAYNCLSHPFETFLETEAQSLSTAAGYGGASRRPSAEGEHQEWQLARGAFAFLIETHTSFQPAYTSAVAEAAAVWPAILSMLARPVSINGHLSSATGGLPLGGSISILELPYTNGEAGFDSESVFGRFDLVLPAGTWTLQFSAPGHQPATHVVTVGAGSLPPLPVILTPAIPDSGQPNTLAAGLEIGGSLGWMGLTPVLGANGPFFASRSPGQVVNLSVKGPAGSVFILLAGPLHRGNANFTGVGALDIGQGGSMGDFSDLVVLLNGVAPTSFLDGLAVLNGNGEQSLAFTMPSGPAGPLFTMQALVYQAAGLPILTAATELARP